MKTNKDYKIKELQVLKDKKLGTKHNEELGLSVPTNYFKTSKNRILEEIESDNAIKKSFRTENKFIWIAVAASITVLLSLTIFNNEILNTIGNSKIVSDTLKHIKTNKLSEENLVLLDSEDISITSLFVEDSELDNYIEKQVIEDIIENELLLN